MDEINLSLVKEMITIQQVTEDMNPKLLSWTAAGPKDVKMAAQ